MKNNKLYAVLALFFTILGACGGYFLSRPAPHQFIQGFDVSHHQQQIDWSKISAQKYRFVYIKATEGISFVDPKFQDNWLKAREAGFLVGAYHFYRLCHDGQTQAQHFIAHVPNKINALAPAIDLEYDEECIDRYSKEQLIHEIQIMHDLLQQHYAKPPIFYVSKNFYNIVLAGYFPETPLWVRDYQAMPELKQQAPWLFWQYSQQGKIEGISTAVDLNLFYGNQYDWQKFLEKNHIPSNFFHELSISK